MVAEGGKAWMEENKKRGLVRTFCKKVFSSQSLVTLHRPLPVTRIFLPGISLCSSTVTRWPSRQAAPAAISPAAPAPTTISSAMRRSPSRG